MELSSFVITRVRLQLHTCTYTCIMHHLFFLISSSPSLSSYLTQHRAHILLRSKPLKQSRSKHITKENHPHKHPQWPQDPWQFLLPEASQASSSIKKHAAFHFLLPLGVGHHEREQATDAVSAHGPPERRGGGAAPFHFLRPTKRGRRKKRRKGPRPSETEVGGQRLVFCSKWRLEPHEKTSAVFSRALLLNLLLTSMKSTSKSRQSSSSYSTPSFTLSLPPKPSRSTANTR